ncbi:flagellar export chaperone FliS [Paenibacillus roseipurpureus]|uniref:Flagellar secretion chaperone FliS n=1 Tax=Paenibacillus roseopurpureus TaxID=2918901 RepID=A0AA96LP91_9BACL|nr:flagellar export chaperone FliS [Paenibacillus sp. MBLB1832]WNR44699.1 flagellar export chaperone FliS [Paenibacillus sp. MBLB1832]
MSYPQRNKYLESSVQTATPAQLLIMLCDGGIRFCRMGIEALKASNFQEANTNLVKVQDIISEFSITLDRSIPIANDLLKLYEYFTRRLVEANMKKEVEPAEEVLGYLMQLKETWMQAAKLAQSTVSPVASGVSHG